MGESVLLLLMSVLFLATVVTKTGGSTLRLQLTGPNMAFLKSTVMFRCEVSLSSVTCDLIKDSGEVLDTEPCGGQPITFHLKVNERSGGEYFCRGRRGGQTEMSNVVNLQVVIPVQGAHVVSEPHPPIIYEGAGFTLRCHVRKGTYLTYMWYHNKEHVTPSSLLHCLSGNTLTVEQASERHAGSYSCMAQNDIKNNTRYSSSIDVTIVVKLYLSAPRVSFSLYRHGPGYHANVSCRSARGTPPVTYQLLLDGKHVGVQHVDVLEAFFTLPVTVGLDMGVLQCSAKNALQQLLSDPVDLEVAPVGGAAYIHMEYLRRTESVVSAALLQCVITRGTFPFFSWSFNHSPVPSEGDSYAFTSHGHILILTEVKTGNSGYYSCKARDSFNSNSTWLKSEEVMVNETGFEASHIEVVAVAFCCFLLVILVGGACCLLRTINHEVDDVENTEHCEHTNTEKETVSGPQIEEAETVLMEVEV